MTRPGPLRRGLDGLARLVHRPAYTGENRCWPCTAANAAIVVALAAAASTLNWLLGAAVLVGGAVLVYLRGYVIPGTPWFGPRLAAAVPFGPDHDPGRFDRSGTLAAGVPPEELLAELVERGVVGTDGDEVVLAAAFRSAWVSRTADLRAAPDGELAERAAAASRGDVEATVEGDRILLAGDRDVWLRRPVAIAEVAAVEALEGDGVPAAVAAPAATPLRALLRTCPACGGPVGETTLRNCCGGPGSVLATPERPALACGDCDAVVLVFDETEGTTPDPDR